MQKHAAMAAKATLRSACKNEKQLSPTATACLPSFAAQYTVSALTLLMVAAIARRQSHSPFDREFLDQVHGITRFAVQYTGSAAARCCSYYYIAGQAG